LEKNLRLKEIRKKLGYTQKEFSGSIGIKQGSYSDIERGKVGISANLMKNLISKYRINPAWLYDGEGEKFLDDFPQKSIQGVKSTGSRGDICENCEKCRQYEKIIEAHLRTIDTQNDYIQSLKSIINAFENLKGEQGK
jgi:transcriptional regulator with XRE-family HTH domain